MQRPDLGPVSRALEGDPMFLAGWLSGAPNGAQWIQDRLALSDEQMHRLLVCRTPRPDTYVADIAAIAGYLDLDETQLAEGLREAAVLAALTQRARSTEQPAE